MYGDISYKPFEFFYEPSVFSAALVVQMLFQTIQLWKNVENIHKIVSAHLILFAMLDGYF